MEEDSSRISVGLGRYDEDVVILVECVYCKRHSYTVQSEVN